MGLPSGLTGIPARRLLLTSYIPSNGRTYLVMGDNIVIPFMLATLVEYSHITRQALPRTCMMASISNLSLLVSSYPQAMTTDTILSILGLVMGLVIALGMWWDTRYQLKVLSSKC